MSVEPNSSTDPCPLVLQSGKSSREPRASLRVTRDFHSRGKNFWRTPGQVEVKPGQMHQETKAIQKLENHHEPSRVALLWVLWLFCFVWVERVQRRWESLQE